MRRTLLRLASVKPTARYLEAGAPTGLTGLMTHGSPRATLLFLYSSTLEKLKAVPEHSLYRQSVEAVTKHRLSIVQATQPPGYTEWATRAQKLVADHPEQFHSTTSGKASGENAVRVERDGKVFVVRKVMNTIDERDEEWNGETDEGPELEGPRTVEEKADVVLNAERTDLGDTQQVTWEAEPQLTADQIEELETKIGAGLIEEVVQVAEGELRLIDTMVKAKVWEDLEEKPVEGQWAAFERVAS